MNLTALQTELAARGLDFLSTSRQTQFLNDAYHEINEAELWPFRLTTATGSAPLTIADLGVIEEVVNTANASTPLSRADRRSLAGWYGDLTTTGVPSWFYVDNGVVRTFPVGGTLSVRYYKAAADLSAGSDPPIFPARFHSLIVDVAQRRALGRDESDQADVALLTAEIQQGLDEMRTALLAPQVQETEMLLDLGASTDW